MTGDHTDIETSKKLLNASKVIGVPSRDAYLTIDDAERALVDAMRVAAQSYHVILLSCGLMARALAKRIFLSGNFNGFIFDLGSVLDAFQKDQQWGWVTGASVPENYWQELIAEIE